MSGMLSSGRSRDLEALQPMDTEMQSQTQGLTYSSKSRDSAKGGELRACDEDGGIRRVRAPRRAPPRPTVLVGSMVGAGRPFNPAQETPSESLPFPSAGTGAEAFLLTGGLPFPDIGYGDRVMIEGFSFEAAEALARGGPRALEEHEMGRHAALVRRGMMLAGVEIGPGSPGGKQSPGSSVRD